MENKKRIIELLTAVRYTTNDIEKVADEICSLFNVSQQRELLLAFEEYCCNLEYLTPNYEVLEENIKDFLANYSG